MSKTEKKTKRTRSKLGRGLSALVDQSSTTPLQVVPGLNIEQQSIQNTNTIGEHDHLIDPESSRIQDSIIEIDVTQIVANPFQPRRVFDEEALEELAQSIAEHGLMQPIAVRDVNDGKYELIAGERRWRATCRTGQMTIRAIVIDVDDSESAQLALIENIQREDLNPIERAKGFESLVSQFSMTQEQIAQKVGINRSSVANFMRLIELDEEIQSMIASNQLGRGHGKVLLSCKDIQQRLKLAKLAAEHNWTVRILEEEVTKSQNDRASNEVNETETTDSNRQPPSRVELVMGDLEKRLSEHLGTAVKLKANKQGTKGSISIEYYDLDHFDGLLSRLGLSAAEELLS
ncbi:MAG: ParB/RepB/Spo0J family partition protein [Phycisphaerales bacterium]|nr:ParB/RepB/Spo0J family partition protein [Phycisphaerales bacterium]